MSKDSYIKELLVLTTHHILEYENSGYTITPDIKELLSLAKELTRKYFKSSKDIDKPLYDLYSKLEIITKGKDVECNTLNLALNGIYLMIEEDILKGSMLMKANRLTRSIDGELRKHIKPNDNGYRNAFIISSKYQDYNKGLNK